MTPSDRDAILDTFARRIASVEQFIPTEPPAGLPTPGRPEGHVAAGSAVRATNRWRSPSRRPSVALPVGIAAAIIVSLLAVGFVNRPDAGPGTAPVASPSATATTAVVPPCPPSAGAASPRPLETSCRYESAVLQPPVALVLDPGWAPLLDTTHQLELRGPTGSASGSASGTITIAPLDTVAQEPCIPSGVPGPTRTWSPGGPPGPQTLMDWIESDTGVAHDPPAPVTIGGRAGLETTLSPGIGSLATCGGVATITDLGGGHHLQVRENESLRLAAIVVGDRTIIIATQVPKAVQMTEFSAKADALIATMSFR